MDRPPRLSLPTSLGLVLLCGGVAAGLALAALATCFRQTGDSLPPGTRVSAICGSTAAQAWFDRGLAVAAAIAIAGVLGGHVGRSRRTAVWSACISSVSSRRSRSAASRRRTPCPGRSVPPV